MTVAQARDGRLAPATIARRSMIGALGLTPLALGACTGGWRFRYRTTVTLVVDGRELSGSAVRELRYRERIAAVGPLDTSQLYFRGEAVLLDLGPRGLLIATLARWIWNDSAQRRQVARYDSGTPIEVLKRVAGPDPDSWRRCRQVIALQPDEFPILVTFVNPADPTTVREVDPIDVSNTLGKGVVLRSITMEVVSARVTRNVISEALPWLASIGMRPLSGEQHGEMRDVAHGLDRSSFEI